MVLQTKIAQGQAQRSRQKEGPQEQQAQGEWIEQAIKGGGGHDVEAASSAKGASNAEGRWEVYYNIDDFERDVYRLDRHFIH